MFVIQIICAASENMQPQRSHLLLKPYISLSLSL